MAPGQIGRAAGRVGVHPATPDPRLCADRCLLAQPKNTVSDFLRHFLLALRFSTRVRFSARLADWVGDPPDGLHAAAAHLPGVGWLVGAVSATVLLAALTLLPWSDHAPFVAAVMCTAAGVWLTGALHEDGLARMVGGLGSAQDRLHALEIMDDARSGGVGPIALLLVVLAKVGMLALLADLDAVLACAGLFAAHAVSRTWPLFTVRTMVHVGDVAGPRSRPVTDRLAPGALFTALVWCGGALVLTSMAIDPLVLLVALLGSALAWVAMRSLLLRRLQGFNVDCLGATQQLCELAFYLGLAGGLAIPA